MNIGNQTVPPFSLSSSTLLDPPESTPYRSDSSASSCNPELPTCLSYSFRHSGWAEDRRRVRNAYVRLCVPPARMQAFARCGSRVWVLRSKSDPSKFRFVPDHCHDRFCVPCARARGAIIRKNLHSHLTDPPYRLLTLTLRATDDALGGRVDTLLASFRRLRARAFWKEKVTGGAAFLEVTLGKQRDHWHAHLHVLLEGKYIPRRQLASTWWDITGDSKIVDIRLVRDAPGAMRYITKYVTKPLPSCVLRDDDRLAHAIKALAGRKLLYAFGSWCKLRLLHNKSDDDWSCLCHIDSLGHDNGVDDALAHQILTAYRAYVSVCDGGIFWSGEANDAPRAPPTDECLLR